LLESGNALGKAMRPDLSDPAALAAYRSELRGLARGWRLLGFVLILAGVAGLFALHWRGQAQPALWWASWAGVAGGWLIFIAVIVHRTRYHKARMAEDPAAP
jgi:hypothetical protein